MSPAAASLFRWISAIMNPREVLKWLSHEFRRLQHPILGA
jgi:hypothetical protein